MNHCGRPRNYPAPCVHYQDAFLSRLLALEDYHKFCEGMCLDTSRLKFSFLDLAALYAHELPESSDSWLRRAGLT